MVYCIPVKIPNLKASKRVLVSKEDQAALALVNWHLVAGYPAHAFYEKGKRVYKYMHQVIMGELPAGKVVDHMDGNKLNNQRSNLRVCTQAENTRNCRVSKNNKSGFKGVHYNKSREPSPWIAQISVNGKGHCLGYFKTLDEARKAYAAGAIKFHGKFARF